jgi:hypothetical protein
MASEVQAVARTADRSHRTHRTRDRCRRCCGVLLLLEGGARRCWAAANQRQRVRPVEAGAFNEASAPTPAAPQAA